MAKLTERQKSEFAAVFDVFYSQVRADILADWAESESADVRERLHAELRGLERVRELVNGETSAE